MATVRLSMDEQHKDALRSIAERERCSVSEWVRRQVRQDDPDRWAPPEPSNAGTAWNDGSAS
ncbi:MAG: hypothetical protein ACPHCN_16140 [Mycobacterium sp.]